MKRVIGFFGVVLWLLGASASGWEESDFPPRPAVAYLFSLDARQLNTVVGEPKTYTFAKGDTIYDVARHLGLGYNEVKDAYPDLDEWVPPEGESVAFPTWWVLPDSDLQGIVVNIPEMRLYYFPSTGKRGEHTVLTYPVGLGRDEWRTPTGKFKVAEKTVDPTWVIPDSIREEHIVQRGDSRRLIPGGDPDNPLGHYRMRLTLPLFGIHGTNIPWGVGMEVSHGCIRLYPEDIAKLFTMVPVGTPGEIIYQPVKIGSRGGILYVEAHQDIYDTGLDYLATARELLHDKGWESQVDWGLLASALAKKTGVPTPITERPISSAPTEAHRVETHGVLGLE